MSTLCWCAWLRAGVCMSVSAGGPAFSAGGGSLYRQSSQLTDSLVDDDDDDDVDLMVDCWTVVDRPNPAT